MASKAAEREQADLQAVRDRAHVRLLREAAPDDVLQDVLRDLRAVLGEQADHIVASRRKGWQTAERANRTAVGCLIDISALLDRHPVPEPDAAPTRPALDAIPSPTRHADLDPADGPLSAQITDRVLGTPDGPFPTPVRLCPAEYPTPAGAAPGARVVRCGRELGHHLGGQLTGSRHAEWVENVDNDGAGGWGPEWDMPPGWDVADPTAPAITHEPASTTGYVTPRTAAAIREQVAAGRTVDDKLTAAFGDPRLEAPAPLPTVETADPVAEMQRDAQDALADVPAAAGFAFPDEPREYAIGDTVTVAGIEFTKIREFDGSFTAPDGGHTPTCHGKFAHPPGAYCASDIPPAPVVVLVTGSRGWTDVGPIHDTLAGLRATVPGLVIRHGRCPNGADAIVDAWCEANGVAQQRRPADWEQHGRAAGPVRNSAMLVEEPLPATFLAFWDGTSPGTKDMIGKCNAAGIRGTVYRPGQPPCGDPAALHLDNVEVVDPVRARPEVPGRRLTHEEVRAIGLAQTHRRQRRSLSQVEQWEGCGTKYAIRHFDTQPAWWFEGGKAVHARIEQINHFWAAGGQVGTAHLVPWEEFFVGWVREVEYLTGVPHEAWRAAKKGSEGYDFWRVSGADAVQRWVDHVERRRHEDWSILRVGPGTDQYGAPANPVVEWEHPMPMSVDGSVPPDLVVLDLALINERQGVIEIVDIKAGAKAPGDGFQLSTYAWGLSHALRATNDRRAELPILASYWMARTGEQLGPHNPRAVYPWSAVLARFQAMHEGESAGVYPARPSNFCVSCGVNRLCPVQVDGTREGGG
jgi:hypothetical protein